ncbi:MAG: hypothetical protein R2777_08685 [Chitinophagales bacterium]
MVAKYGAIIPFLHANFINAKKLVDNKTDITEMGWEVSPERDIPYN